MNDEPSTLPQPEALKSEQVLLLPGHLFFIECVELPKGLEDSEIKEFAELSIESIAPFPIEQLNWGFLYAEDASSLLVYAAHRDRLKKEGIEEIEAYAWVLPDFASIANASFSRDNEVILLNDQSLSYLRFEGGRKIPTTILSRPLRNDDSLEQLVLELRAQAPELAADATSLEIRPLPVKIDEQGRPEFTFESIDPYTQDAGFGDWASLHPSEQELWQADVRSTEFKNAERSARRTGALLTRITGWAAIAIFVLIGLEVGLFAAQAWLGTREKRIATQQPTVARIEDKQSLMNKLEQVAQNELRPIAILEALNDSRPKGIYFTSTLAEGENRITIDGIANTINELNRYTDMLSKSGSFELIGTPKSITRSGTTTFTVTLDYRYNDVVQPTVEERQVESKEDAI